MDRLPNTDKSKIFLFATRLGKYSLATWNFFEASHGKGAPDGIGGALKRTAARLTRQVVDLSTPKQVHNAHREISSYLIYQSVSDEPLRKLKSEPSDKEEFSEMVHLV